MIQLLSQRESEVLQYVAKGYTAKSIAQILSLNARTIEAHVIKIKKKLNARNVSHAIYIACRDRILGNTQAPVE